MRCILHYLHFFVCSRRSTTVMEPFCVRSSKSLKKKLRAVVHYLTVEWLLWDF